MEINLPSILVVSTEKLTESDEKPTTTDPIELYKQHVPKYLRQRLLQRISRGEKINAESNQVFASVLFADISGFTQLSSRLSAEELQCHINEYFTKLLGIVEENAGDVVKFCGDAVMIMWSVPLDASEETKAATVLMSAVCALQMLEECGEYRRARHHLSNVQASPVSPMRSRLSVSRTVSPIKIPSPSPGTSFQSPNSPLRSASGSPHRASHPAGALSPGLDIVELSLHCGISCGPVHCMMLGDAQRLEFILSGEVISQMGTAESCAEAGEVCLHPAAYEKIRDKLGGVAVYSPDSGTKAAKSNTQVPNLQINISSPSLLTEFYEEADAVRAFEDESELPLSDNVTAPEATPAEPLVKCISLEEGTEEPQVDACDTVLPQPVAYSLTGRLAESLELSTRRRSRPSLRTTTAVATSSSSSFSLQDHSAREHAGSMISFSVDSDRASQTGPFVSSKWSANLESSAEADVTPDAAALVAETEAARQYALHELGQFPTEDSAAAVTPSSKNGLSAGTVQYLASLARELTGISARPRLVRTKNRISAADVIPQAIFSQSAYETRMERDDRVNFSASAGTATRSVLMSPSVKNSSFRRKSLFGLFRSAKIRSEIVDTEQESEREATNEFVSSPVGISSFAARRSIDLSAKADSPHPPHNALSSRFSGALSSSSRHGAELSREIRRQVTRNASVLYTNTRSSLDFFLPRSGSMEVNHTHSASRYFSSTSAAAANELEMDVFRDGAANDTVSATQHTRHLQKSTQIGEKGQNLGDFGASQATSFDKAEDNELDPSLHCPSSTSDEFVHPVHTSTAHKPRKMTVAKLKRKLNFCTDVSVRAVRVYQNDCSHSFNASDEDKPQKSNQEIISRPEKFENNILGLEETEIGRISGRKETLEHTHAVRLQRELRRFTHETAARAIDSSTVSFLSEMRDVAVVFVQILDLEEEFSAGLFHKPQRVLCVILKLLRQFGGSLRQFAVDDKGCVAIGCFGLSGSSNQNNCVQAVEFAVSARTLLHTLGCRSAQGITLGRVYCGLVGAAGRCEYAVMGSSVNLAARLMAACASSLAPHSTSQPLASHSLQPTSSSFTVSGPNRGVVPRGVFVDAAVHQHAHQQFHFLQHAHIKAKGYSEPVPVFVAVHKKTNIRSIRAPTMDSVQVNQGCERRDDLFRRSDRRKHEIETLTLSESKDATHRTKKEVKRRSLCSSPAPLLLERDELILEVVNFLVRNDDQDRVSSERPLSGFASECSSKMASPGAGTASKVPIERCVLIEGPAGVGRSSLLRQILTTVAATAAESNHDTLLTHRNVKIAAVACNPANQYVPYDLVRALLFKIIGIRDSETVSEAHVTTSADVNSDESTLFRSKISDFGPKRSEKKLNAPLARAQSQPVLLEKQQKINLLVEERKNVIFDGDAGGVDGSVGRSWDPAVFPSERHGKPIVDSNVRAGVGRRRASDPSHKFIPSHAAMDRGNDPTIGDRTCTASSASTATNTTTSVVSSSNTENLITAWCERNVPANLSLATAFAFCHPDLQLFEVLLFHNKHTFDREKNFTRSEKNPQHAATVAALCDTPLIQFLPLLDDLFCSNLRSVSGEMGENTHFSHDLESFLSPFLRELLTNVLLQTLLLCALGYQSLLTAHISAKFFAEVAVQSNTPSASKPVFCILAADDLQHADSESVALISKVLVATEKMDTSHNAHSGSFIATYCDTSTELSSIVTSATLTGVSAASFKRSKPLRQSSAMHTDTCACVEDLFCRTNVHQETPSNDKLVQIIRAQARVVTVPRLSKQATRALISQLLGPQLWTWLINNAPLVLGTETESAKIKRSSPPPQSRAAPGNVSASQADSHRAAALALFLSSRQSSGSSLSPPPPHTSHHVNSANSPQRRGSFRVSTTASAAVVPDRTLHTTDCASGIAMTEASAASVGTGQVRPNKPRRPRGQSDEAKIVNVIHALSLNGLPRSVIEISTALRHAIDTRAFSGMYNLPVILKRNKLLLEVLDHLSGVEVVVLKAAAVIGCSFDVASLVAALMGMDMVQCSEESVLSGVLARLASVGLVRRARDCSGGEVGGEQHPTLNVTHGDCSVKYEFSENTTQLAIYNLMLETQRAVAHGAIGAHLEQSYKCTYDNESTYSERSTYNIDSTCSTHSTYSTGSTQNSKQADNKLGKHHYTPPQLLHITHHYRYSNSHIKKLEYLQHIARYYTSINYYTSTIAVYNELITLSLNMSMDDVVSVCRENEVSAVAVLEMLVLPVAPNTSISGGPLSTSAVHATDAVALRQQLFRNQVAVLDPSLLLQKPRHTSQNRPAWWRRWGRDSSAGSGAGSGAGATHSAVTSTVIRVKPKPKSKPHLVSSLAADTAHALQYQRTVHQLSHLSLSELLARRRLLLRVLAAHGAAVSNNMYTPHTILPVVSVRVEAAMAGVNMHSVAKWASAIAELSSRCSEEEEGIEYAALALHLTDLSSIPIATTSHGTSALSTTNNKQTEAHSIFNKASIVSSDKSTRSTSSTNSVFTGSNLQCSSEDSGSTIYGEGNVPADGMHVPAPRTAPTTDALPCCGWWSGSTPSHGKTVVVPASRVPLLQLLTIPLTPTVNVTSAVNSALLNHYPTLPYVLYPKRNATHLTALYALLHPVHAHSTRMHVYRSIIALTKSYMARDDALAVVVLLEPVLHTTGAMCSNRTTCSVHNAALALLSEAFQVLGDESASVMCM